jgi:hypothetical protein
MEEIMRKDQELPEHYLEAQRAAVEAVDIGRATLMTAECQGEQLRNADRLADETNYILDRSTRLLKGMTWTGWVQNMFTPDAKAPLVGKPTPIEDIPPFAKKAAQTIQNYQANLTVLESCDTAEQRQTCHIICNNMFETAEMEVNRLLTEDNNPQVVQQLSQHLSKLHQLQKDVIQRQLKVQQKSMQVTSASTPQQTSLSKLQDEHLDMLASNLSELSVMATSLNEQFNMHSNLMASLEEKADDMHEKTRAVTRRADRLTQKKSWTGPKCVFEKWISIQHLDSGRYLSTDTNGNLLLLDTFHPEKCVYGVWMRKSCVFGLKNKYSSRYLGQTILGSLVCSASCFGQREEWQADENWEKSRLLIASAGWGNGGYLKVRPRDGALQIVDKTQADLWCLPDLHTR